MANWVGPEPTEISRYMQALFQPKFIRTLFQTLSGHQTSKLEQNFFISFLPTSSLDQKELKKRADFQVGLEMIRTFVVGIDSTYKDKDDFQILAVVQNLSEEVRHLAIKNDKLQKEIDIISKNVNDGWVFFATAYYWFSHGPQSWMNSKNLCEKEGAKLLSLKTAVEQRFVVNEVKARRKLFWIGLFKDNKAKWRWLSGIEALVT
ncbi:CD209 antigen-like protein C [Podarcis muralis]